MKNFIIIMVVLVALTVNAIPTKAQVFDPFRYLANLQFDGCDFFDSGESNFPLSFRFNNTQDANGDSSTDAEDNLENLLLYSIGSSLYGTGRTGISDRGPNNQKPALYFHLVRTPDYDVYEYWLYYADNNWINDHEHDWEKYFVYVKDTIPYYILLSSHSTYNIYSWPEITSVNYHANVGVDGGSHAMKNSGEDGVSISCNGNIRKNNGTLITTDNITIPWTVYSNDTNIVNCINYVQSPDTFYYGDPHYFTNNNEWGDPKPAPWIRDEWNNPPAVNITGFFLNNIEQKILCYPNPASDIVTLNLNNTNNVDLTLNIYNIIGELVRSELVQQNQQKINISDFSNGIYMIEIKSKEWAEKQKLIINN